MLIDLHKQATTTLKVRVTIQESGDVRTVLEQRCGVKILEDECRVATVWKCSLRMSDQVTLSAK